MALNPILMQAFYYFVVVVIAVFGVNMLLRGFFMKYVKVRMSFGKLLLVKIRHVNQDSYAVGKIGEGNLLEYKLEKEVASCLVPKNRPCIYKSIGIGFIDVDGETGGICSVDYSALEGFDMIRFSSLLKRALYKPEFGNNREKLIFIMLILTLAGVALSLYLNYANSNAILEIKQLVTSGASNTIKAGATL